MIPSSAPDFESGSAANRRPRPVQEVRALVEHARPDLVSETPEYQAAVLLLCVRDVGMNVDRLAIRTRIPREFIARCVRRLADNGCWTGAGLATTWHDPSSDDFWLDVDVALGRCLRRIDEAGRPEWAPVGEWVKDFNYRRGNSADSALANEYYAIAPHDPEPDARREEAPAGAAEEDAATASPSPGVQAAPARSGWLGMEEEEEEEEGDDGPDGDDEPDGDDDASDQPPTSPPPSGMLVETWSGANWLG